MKFRYIMLAALLAVLAAESALADITVTNPDGRDRVVTTRELACVSHIVVDAEAWTRHAASVDMLWAIQAKVDTYCPRMEADKALLGPAYKNRAEREAARTP
jgi:hypothetical protein